MCIGLRYSDPSELSKLMHVSIEISRLTHTHVCGYLSGFTSALFISYAIQKKSIHQWIPSLLNVLEDVKKWIQSEKRDDLPQTMRHWLDEQNDFFALSSIYLGQLLNYFGKIFSVNKTSILSIHQHVINSIDNSLMLDIQQPVELIHLQLRKLLISPFHHADQ